MAPRNAVRGSQKSSRRQRGRRGGKDRKLPAAVHNNCSETGTVDRDQFMVRDTNISSDSDEQVRRPAGGAALNGDLNDQDDESSVESEYSVNSVSDDLASDDMAPSVTQSNTEQPMVKGKAVLEQHYGGSPQNQVVAVSFSFGPENAIGGVGTQPTSSNFRISRNEFNNGSNKEAQNATSESVANLAKHENELSDSSLNGSVSDGVSTLSRHITQHSAGFAHYNVDAISPGKGMTSASTNTATRQATTQANRIISEEDRSSGMLSRAPASHLTQNFNGQSSKGDSPKTCIVEDVTHHGNVRIDHISEKEEALKSILLAGSQQGTFHSYRHAAMSNTNQTRAITGDLVRTSSSPAQLPVDASLVTRTWAPVSSVIRQQRSQHLNKLVDGINGAGPSLTELLDPEHFPFVETFTMAKPCNHGVVVIKNIPFQTTRAEVVAFLGRNSKILNDADEPVHIIIDRVTSKTKDAYIEFVTMGDAMRAVQRHQTTVERGRTARLGDRPVTVELSSIDTLMAELFPHAWVVWQHGVPLVKPSKEGDYAWQKFDGFITEEEMIMLVKHVEQPYRNPFSKDCPQRPYECMISTINKMPWYCGDLITIKQRSAMHKAILKLMQHLHANIEQERQPNSMSSALLKRISIAAMACPGFSVVQKDDIAFLSNLDTTRTRMFGQPRGAHLWTHHLTLGPKKRVSADVLEWYIAFIREESVKWIMSKPMAERNALIARAPERGHYFGFLWHELNYPRGEAYDQMTLREAADRELAATEAIIRRAFLG